MQESPKKMEMALKGGNHVGRFNAQDQSPALQSRVSQGSHTSSILAKMKNRLVHYNVKVGQNDSDHDPALFDQYNDMNFARRKRFDFVQSSFLGQQHLRSAVRNEMVRVMANGKKLNGLQ